MDLPGPDPIYTTLTDVTEFATDSLLEETGFEPPVPLERGGAEGSNKPSCQAGKAVVSAAFGRASGEDGGARRPADPSREGVVPIVRNGVLEGACGVNGVNGGTTQQDEDCGRAGVARL
jgi:Haem-degrading